MDMAVMPLVRGCEARTETAAAPCKCRRGMRLPIPTAGGIVGRSKQTEESCMNSLDDPFSLGNPFSRDRSAYHSERVAAIKLWTRQAHLPKKPDSNSRDVPRDAAEENYHPQVYRGCLRRRCCRCLVGLVA